MSKYRLRVSDPDNELGQRTASLDARMRRIEAGGRTNPFAHSRKFVDAIVGDGTASQFRIEHDLESEDVIAAVHGTSAPYSQTALSDDLLVIEFDAPLASGTTLKVVVIS